MPTDMVTAKFFGMRAILTRYKSMYYKYSYFVGTVWDCTCIETENNPRPAMTEMADDVLKRGNSNTS
jgi:hypothetical protein